MDERDLRILEALMSNSRTSYVELAERLGVTEAAVRKRVKKLERNGVISGFTAMVDPSVLGFEAVAIIGVDTEPYALAEVYEKLKKLREVKYTALCSGDHMVMFEAWCRSQKELSTLIRKVGNMGGVTRVCPAVLMKKREFGRYVGRWP